MTTSVNPTVTLTTSHGAMKIELFPEQAPDTVANFLAYVDDKFFDNTIFHRVIDGFMVQGGGFTEDMRQKPTKANIRNEANNGLKNTKGTLAMARTNDPHSASSQFFINHKDNDFLNYQGQHNFGYAVFGKVVEGLDVLEAISKVATGSKSGHSDVPKSPVVIQAAVRS